MAALKKITSYQWILLGIILVGSILRFWNFSEIPFTHDEFNPLRSYNFESFSEAIEKGVKVDTHPAGVYLFIFAWMKLFGASEIAVKLPFIIMGILSIPLVYRIGKLWFNDTVGLVSAAFLATIQYTITFSMIARPYVSGLFLCLLLVWHWSHVIKHPEKQPLKHYVLFILFGALCAYNHHFSLLFAAIIGLSGVLFVKRKYLWKYALSGVIIFLLYLPHLNIFFLQLGLGGVESWLAKPTSSFIWEYLGYIFHFSIPVYIVVILLVLYGIIQRKWPSKYFFLSLLWFGLPFAIGYYYSVYENAVLQFSVLIFSFPFLLFTLFSLLPQLTPKRLAPIILVICAINIYSLVQDREYYTLFYQNRHKQFLVDIQEQVDQLGPENCTVLLANNPRINRYFYDKMGLNFKYHNILKRGQLPDYDNYAHIQRLVDTASTKYFIYGNLAYAPGACYSMIKRQYPTLVLNKYYWASSMQVFERSSRTTEEYVFNSFNKFEKHPEGWNYNKEHAANGRYEFLPEETFGPSFELALNDLDLHKNDLLDFSVDIYLPDSLHEVMLVQTLYQGDEEIAWSAASTNNFDFKPGTWQSVHLSTEIRSVDLTQPTRLKTYVWNKGQGRVYIDNYSVSIRKGNPTLYGLKEKIVRR